MKTPLIVRRVDAICVRLPMARPLRMAHIDIRHSDNMLVRIESTSGLTGWGESTFSPSFGGSTLPEMVHTIENEVRGYLPGKDALGLSAHTAQLARLKAGKADNAIAAVDMALYDLVGKSLGQPAHLLLGGLRRASIAPLWLIGTDSLEADMAEAEARYQQGYRFFKLKLAVKSLQDDIASTRALHARFPDMRLCADANECMTADTALAYTNAVADCGLVFLEQPIPRADLGGLRRLCAASPVPIGLDEAIGSSAALLRLAPLGIGGAALKTIKLGGLSGVVAAGHVCESLGLRINLSGKIAETSVGSAALLQLGGVLPDVHWGVSPAHLYLGEDIVAAPLQPIDGTYAVPTLPGLGVEVDEARVERLRIAA
ncbi:MAG: enolase C-terminal domain-like protein [Pseudomonadota bacterium]